MMAPPNITAKVVPLCCKNSSFRLPALQLKEGNEKLQPWARLVSFCPLLDVAYLVSDNPRNVPMADRPGLGNLLRFPRKSPILLIRQMIAAFIGTFWLVFAGIGTSVISAVFLNKTGTTTFNIGTVFIRVIFSVGSVIPPPPNLPILVSALRADTGALVQRVTVNPTQSLSWNFASLPAGTYAFTASSDIDFDGVLLENGDICGQYGGDLAPATVTVLPNATTRNIDFTVAARTLLPGDR